MTETESESNLTQRLADDVLASLDGRAVRPVALAVLAAEVGRLRGESVRESVAHTARAVEQFGAHVNRMAEWREAIARDRATRDRMRAERDKERAEALNLRERIGELTALIEAREDAVVEADRGYQAVMSLHIRAKLRAEAERDALLADCEAYLNWVSRGPISHLTLGNIQARMKATVARIEQGRAAETPDAPAAEPTPDASTEPAPESTPAPESPPTPDQITRDDLARQLIGDRTEARRLDEELQRVKAALSMLMSAAQGFVEAQGTGPTLTRGGYNRLMMAIACINGSWQHVEAGGPAS